MGRLYRISAMVLSVIMIMSVVPISSFTAVAGGGDWEGYYDVDGIFEYYYDYYDQVAHITGIIDKDIGGDITIPATIAGHKVNGISYSAFEDCINIDSVVILDGIEYISNDAFKNCSSLKSVIIPDSVTSIHYEAFSDCTNLSNIVMSDNIIEIAPNVFNNTAYYNNQENWENGVLYIGNCLIKAENISGEYVINPGTKVIAGEAFMYGCYLTNIAIPNSIITIGRGAFYWCDITSVNIPDSVVTIGAEAFALCSELAEVNIGNSVKTIERQAFYRCSNLESITIPDSVTFIDGSAFSDCTNLSSVNIGNGVERIDYGAFENCVKLASIKIPDSVKSMGDGVFKGCTGLESVTLPVYLEIIESELFKGCTGLTSIVIPDSVTEIYWNAFNGCTGLKNITISAAVTEIGGGAFSGCTNLESISVDEGNKFYMSVDNCLIETESKTLIVGNKNGIIPNDGSVTAIGEYAFNNCTELKSIAINDCIKSIGHCAFEGCTGLTSVTIPDSVTSIGNGAFSGCTSLESVSIPCLITEISYEAFNGCTSLSSVIIPNSVTSISSDAFRDCISLSFIAIPSSVVEIGNGAFYNTGYYRDKDNWENGVLYLDGCLINTEWGFGGDYTIKSGTRIIAESAFTSYSCSGELTSIIIPNSVKTIGSSAFSGCTGLTSITIPDSVTSIGYEAFSGCTGLTSITIPDSVTEIGYYAFGSCYNLSEINLPDTGINILNDAFSGTACYTDQNNWDNGAFYIGSYLIEVDQSLTGSFKVKDGTKYIANSAFYYCTGIKQVDIPFGVEIIGDYAFSNCWNLNKIILPASLKKICDNGFDNSYLKIYYVGTKQQWESIDFPERDSYKNILYGYDRNCPYEYHIINDQVVIDGLIDYESDVCNIPNVISGCPVTIIGAQAFSDCTGLTSVTIPDSVTSIGDFAFYGCTGLISVTIPDSVTSIGNSAFSYCTGLKSIVIPDSVTSIGNWAFSGCTGLETITVENGNTIYHSVGNCLIETESKTLILGCNKSIIPNDDSVTSIGSYAFENCTGLSSIIIPDSITLIVEGAFYGCTSLKDVYYTGTEKQKGAIQIDNKWEDNNDLLNAVWHYNYNPEAPHCIEHIGTWKTVTKATLTEKGLKQEICTKCGATINQEEIPALGVTYDIENAATNSQENISVAVSDESNLPATVEVKAEKTEVLSGGVTYEIHLENEGAEVQPEAPVLVKLPVPAGFDRDKLNIYRKEADGSKTRLDYIIDGDFAYFETDHFSIYEILEKLCGDINSDNAVNNKDLTRLFKYLSGWDVNPKEEMLDINGDGKVNNKDLTRLFQYLSGWAVDIF